GPLPPLPQVILRNAQIDYAEVQNGVKTSAGSMNIEGQFAPTSNEQRYTFELQSRGGGISGLAPAPTPGPGSNSGAIGPTVTGSLDRKSGEVKAALRDFKFGTDIRSMLPKQVRAWWDDHQLAGGVDIPVFSYIPPSDQEPEPQFRVETDFKDVALTIQPAEWMSR